MAATNKARINFRLREELKKKFDDAAAELGQSFSDFAISTLTQAARQVLRDHEITRLSERDRRRFVAMLDNVSSKPNKALTRAARQYRQQVG